MKENWTAVVAFLMTIGLLVGPASEGETASKKYFSLGTGNPGGTYYFIGAGFANLINKNVPGVRVIAESTAASEENYHLLLRKKLDLAMVSIQIMDAALKKNLDISGIRLIALGSTSDRHWFVRRESPVKRIADFRGRRIAVGSPGSGTLVTNKIELVESFGLNFDKDFTPAYLSYTEAVSAIKDQTIDVGLVSAGYPVANLLDLSRQIPLRLIPYSEEEMKHALIRFPYRVRVVIPKGTYHGIDVDNLVPGTPTALFCRLEMNEDLVYRMIKAIYENPKEKDAIHPQAREWNLQNMFRGMEYTTRYHPFHPGAVQYLKEKGVWKGNN
jgi:hypothetical protein